MLALCFAVGFALGCLVELMTGGGFPERIQLRGTASIKRVSCSHLQMNSKRREQSSTLVGTDRRQLRRTPPESAAGNTFSPLAPVKVLSGA